MPPDSSPSEPGSTAAAPIDPSTIVASSSWGVCRLVTPSRLPGIGGSDLGFSFLAPVTDAATGAASELVFLFGNTWHQASDACFHTSDPSDDLQATMPAERPLVLSPGPPTASAASTCADLQIATEPAGSAEQWRPIRVFDSAAERTPETLLQTGFLRAPVTGFADGEHAYGVFLRNQPVHCTTTADCPSDSRCSLEPFFPERLLGECTGTRSQEGGSPTYCIGPSRCADGSLCGVTAQGVCLAEPFAFPNASGEEIPDWYARDPRLAIMVEVDIASAYWPDRPEDYAVGHRFATNKFVNSVARTVAHFDPEDPSVNDYRPGHHTLLLWGRPAFWTSGGAQAPLFLLYQPLDGLLDPQGTIHWNPAYFAGYDQVTGKPRWSPRESEALPVYGTAPEDSEFDLVAHAAMTWVEPLSRWVMFYGGSVPEWIRVDQATGALPSIVHEQPVPGAIHMRTAAHPWGRATLGAASDQAWSAPTPVLVSEELAELLGCEQPDAVASAGCTVPRSPTALVAEVVDWATQTTPDSWSATAGARRQL